MQKSERQSADRGLVPSDEAASGPQLKRSAPWLLVLILAAVVFWLCAIVYNMWGYRKGLWDVDVFFWNYVYELLILQPVYLLVIWGLENLVWRKRARSENHSGVTIVLGFYAGAAILCFCSVHFH